MPPAVYIVMTGIWLIIAPFVLDYAGLPDASGARWNDIIVGAVLIVIGCTHRRNRAVRLTPVLLSLWLLVTPFVLRYSDTGEAVPPIWNDIVSGLVLLMFAAVNWLVTRPRTAWPRSR